MEPKKEQKFLVVKGADITEYFSSHIGVFQPENLQREEKIFNRVLENIQKERTAQGKKENKYIVVNQDEPYAEQVWQLVLEGERQKQTHKQNTMVKNNGT